MLIVSCNIRGNKECAKNLVAKVKDIDPDIVIIQGSNEYIVEYVMTLFKKINKTCKRCNTGVLYMVSSEYLDCSIEYLKFAMSNGVLFFKLPNGLGIFSSLLPNGGESNVARRNQINEICNILINYEHQSIFMGDLSLPNWQKIEMPKGIYDAYLEIGTESHEYTFGDERPDRCFYTSCSENDLTCKELLVYPVYENICMISALFE